ncbi:MAG: SIMPL domain-containing protein [Solirubrobacterales bacterium]|nr:SIMPL domain-containing protein [Solirubrobacterales bacterium]
MIRRTLTPLLTLLLALALLAPTSALAVERTVSVTGTATLKVPNDSATLGFSVGLERRTRGAALSAVSADLKGVIAAVQGIPGVGAGDVKTGRISVRKTFRGKRPVYKAAEGIGVTLHQPDQAGSLVTAAIGAGATGVSGPNFFVGDTETAFSSALAAAFAKAKARATILATQAGASLGPALEIDEGEGPGIEFTADGKTVPAGACGTAGPTVTATKRAGSACSTPPPTKPGNSTVTATVHVIFAL